MRRFWMFISLLILISCESDLDAIENVSKGSDLEIVIETGLEDGSDQLVENRDVKSIEALLAGKINAIETKDLDAYMDYIYPEDPYYFNEQKRWFTEMTKPGVSDLSYTIEIMDHINENELIVTIGQSHFYKETVEITYPVRFIKLDGLWYDAGYPFMVLETDLYKLLYMPDENRLTEFKLAIDEAYRNLSRIFEETPDENFEIKLYTDRELLRQTTIPTIGWLFTGWGEADESLKIWTGHESIMGYKGTFQHELIHHITMGICNNNLPGWIADGVALHYGNYYLEGGDAISLGYASKDQVRVPLDHLEQEDLWDASTQRETWDWYNTSQMYVAFIIDVYGQDALMALFYEAGKKVYNKNVMNPEFKQMNNTTMSEVFDSVLRKTKGELTEEYYQWLDQNY